jgi:2'-5' RNA ligase
MEAPAQRLFISLGFPEPCRNALGTLYVPDKGVAWSRPEQLHLTMRFLGDVDGVMAERIERELARVRVEPFILPLEGVGRFPPRGPTRVLWAGIGRGHTLLYQLRQQIDDAALAAGWRGLLRSFDPHITVGRVLNAEPAFVDQWLVKNRDFAGPPFRVGEFHLMASELRSEGAVHTLRKAFPLGLHGGRNR